MKTAKKRIPEGLVAAILVFLAVSFACSDNKPDSGSPVLKDAQSDHLPYSVKDGDTTWVQVDRVAVFTGGDEGLMKYIRENVKYPDNAKKAGVQGRVLVRFRVSTEGKIDMISILKGIDPELDNEAMRVVSILPAFEAPAMKDKKPVAFWYVLPISFTLK